MVKNYFSCLWHCWFNQHITTLTAWLFFMMPGAMMLMQNQYLAGSITLVGFFLLVPVLIMLEISRDKERAKRYYEHIDRTNPS